jgi:hypothetical protein
VDVVQSVGRAEKVIDNLERKLSADEKRLGIGYYYAFTSRRVGRGWQKRSP